MLQRNGTQIDATVCRVMMMHQIAYPYGKFVADVDDIQSYINNINEVNTNYMKQIACR